MKIEEKRTKIALKRFSGILAFFGMLGLTSAADLTFFDADFNGTSVADVGDGTYGAQITAANLNAGTPTGTWTINAAQAAPANKIVKMIQTDGGTDVLEKALRFGISIDGTTGVDSPTLTANLTSSLGLSAPITVSLDYASAAGDGKATDLRRCYLTGLDGSGNRAFQLAFVNTSTSNSSNDGHRVGYVDSNGVLQLLGAAGDLGGNNGRAWASSLMKTVTIVVGATSYDISLDSTSLATGIAFRDASASGLDSLAVSTSTKWTGGYIDNLVVTQASPAVGTMIIIK